MSTEVAVRGSHDLSITDEQITLIKRTVAKDASDLELQLYFHDCKRHGVHPLDKLIHFTKRSGKYTPITSIDLLRSRAADTDELAGIDDPVYRGDPMKPDFTATVTVYRLVKGQRCPFTASARWAEYLPSEGFMWKKMPHLMIGKCAEALALRKAFPKQLAGLYAKEEMGPEDGSDHHDHAETPAARQIPVSQSRPSPDPASKFVTPTDPKPAAPKPVEAERKTISKHEAEEIGKVLTANNIPWKWLLERLEVARAGEITLTQFDAILNQTAALKKECLADTAVVEDEFTIVHGDAYEGADEPESAAV